MSQSGNGKNVFRPLCSQMGTSPNSTYQVLFNFIMTIYRVSDGYIYCFLSYRVSSRTQTINNETGCNYKNCRTHDQHQPKFIHHMPPNYSGNNWGSKHLTSQSTTQGVNNWGFKPYTTYDLQILYQSLAATQEHTKSYLGPHTNAWCNMDLNPCSFWWYSHI
jgi:hypothetical protein